MVVIGMAMVGGHDRVRRMKATQQLVVVLAMLVCLGGQLLGQATPGAVPVKKPTVDTEEWEFNLTVDGGTATIIPDGISYVDPVFSADYKKLHLEGRYNYENLHTGSAVGGLQLQPRRRGCGRQVGVRRSRR